MLNKVSKFVVFLAFSINVFLAGLSRGFAFHFHKYGLYGVGFGVDSYIIISFFWLFFLFGTIIKKRLLSNIICFFSLSCIVYQYKCIYLYKKLLSDVEEPLSLMFRESTPLDVLGFSLVLILLAFQIATAFMDYMEWSHNSAKIK